MQMLAWRGERTLALALILGEAVRGSGSGGVLLVSAWMEAVPWAVPSSEVGQEAGWRGQPCWGSPVPHWRDWLDMGGSHGALMAELLPMGHVLAQCNQGDMAF